MTSGRAAGSLLPAELKLTGDEQRAVDAGPRPPFRITRHWLSLLNGDADDPLRRQVIPTTAEQIRGTGELADPLGEEAHAPLPRLIRRYAEPADVPSTVVTAFVDASPETTSAILPINRPKPSQSGWRKIGK